MRNLPINSCQDNTSSESSDSDDSSNDSMEGDFFQGGGGGLALILSLGEGGGVEINFCLMRGGYEFTHFPALPPLQVIIAQSLNALKTLFRLFRVLLDL